MVDPVLCPEGHSFERAAIEAWLRTHNTNPVTRKPLTADQLSPNRALKESIALFLEKHGDAVQAMRHAATGTKETTAAAASAEQAGPSTGPPKLPTAFTGGAGGPAQPQLPIAGAPIVKMTLFDQGADAASKQLQTLPFAPKVRQGFRRKLVQVEIVPPNPAALGRTPCDIVCVVDVSGSMCSAAKAKDADGKSEDTGLSVLDVTKHAVSTVMAVLGPEDRFSLVSYSNSAKVEHSLAPMTANNRARAKVALERLTPGGSTNLWDGVQKALDTLREGTEAGSSRHQAVLLLTDGCPNITPPRGHVPTLKRYLDKHPLDCCLHTFGFGYSLDSALLSELATEGNGQYAFIPDAGLVGTVFVNALSNILSTQAKNVKVQLAFDTDSVHVVKDSLVQFHKSTATTWGVELALGSLNYGQPRTVALQIEVPADASDLEIGGSVKMQFVQSGAASNAGKLPLGNVETLLPDLSLSAEAAPAAEVVDPAVCRAALAAALDAGVRAVNSRESNSRKVAVSAVQMAIRFVKARLSLVKSVAGDNAAAAAKLTEDLLTDLTGECSLAFANNTDCDRWGRHYAPSLAFAHRCQRCNNFKDPGVQHYGGALFEAIRDEADDTFLQLPPPTASRRAQVERASKGRRVAPVNMRNYYNCSGGCIAPSCLATMADGSKKAVSELRGGDVVAVAGGGSAIVSCVVETATENGKVEMATFNDGALKITPWHPIRQPSKNGAPGSWTFPNNAVKGQTSMVECDSMYTFVLVGHSGSSAPTGIVVDGIECCSLGHGVLGDRVLSHSFLGTEKIVDALSRCRGWDAQHIRLQQGDYVRDPESNQIVDIVQH